MSVPLAPFPQNRGNPIPRHRDGTKYRFEVEFDWKIVVLEGWGAAWARCTAQAG